MKTKSKITILSLAYIVTFIFCYHFAISKTLVVKNQYQTLKQQESLFTNIPKQIFILKQKQKHYDSLLSKYQLKGNSLQNNLLKTINTLADSLNLKVNSFLEPHSITQNNLEVNTHQFSLEGDYNAIITLIHNMEQNTKFGEIINLHFEKNKNFRTGKYYLQASVLLKSFE